MVALTPKQLGKVVLSQGFETWMKAMFYQIEGRIFTREPLHDKIFDTFQRVFDLDEILQYINKNLPPRSGKTITACYFIAFVIAHKKQCEFIYTSQSAKLLRDVADNISKVLNSEIYKSMYGLEAETQSVSTSFVDEYFKNYFEKTQREERTSFSASLIKVGNAKIHLSPLGGQIVGLGFGVRDATYYSGGLFLDDIDKPSDVKSSLVIREKTHEFFSSTLITRANNPKANVMNIQQRICIGDMSDFLADEYGFNTVKAPLFVDDVLQLPKQYNDRRVAMIKINMNDFVAQYQQSPVMQGGNMFKKDWFEISNVLPESVDYTFIVADTAYNAKQTNDYTSFTLWGVKGKHPDIKLYRMDARHERINAVEIEEWILPWIRQCMNNKLRYIWIEPQGHGIYLNQRFKRLGLPIPPEEDMKLFMTRSGKKSEERLGAGDKIERANHIIPRIDRERKNIVLCKSCPDHQEFMDELTSFPDAKHDDTVDTFIDAVNIAFNRSVIDWSKILD